MSMRPAVGARLKQVPNRAKRSSRSPLSVTGSIVMSRAAISALNTAGHGTSREYPDEQDAEQQDRGEDHSCGGKAARRIAAPAEQGWPDDAAEIGYRIDQRHGRCGGS